MISVAFGTLHIFLILMTCLLVSGCYSNAPVMDHASTTQDISNPEHDRLAICFYEVLEAASRRLSNYQS